MTLFAVEIDGGAIGLMASSTLQSAYNRALKQQGADNLRRVRYARAADVAWIRGMGGRIPKGSIKRRTKRDV